MDGTGRGWSRAGGARPIQGSFLFCSRRRGRLPDGRSFARRQRDFVPLEAIQRRPRDAMTGPDAPRAARRPSPSHSGGEWIEARRSRGRRRTAKAGGGRERGLASPAHGGGSRRRAGRALLVLPKVGLDGRPARGARRRPRLPLRRVRSHGARGDDENVRPAAARRTAGRSQAASDRLAEVAASPDARAAIVGAIAAREMKTVG